MLRISSLYYLEISFNLRYQFFSHLHKRIYGKSIINHIIINARTKLIPINHYKNVGKCWKQTSTSNRKWDWCSWSSMQSDDDWRIFLFLLSTLLFISIQCKYTQFRYFVIQYYIFSFHNVTSIF